MRCSPQSVHTQQHRSQEHARAHLNNPDPHLLALEGWLEGSEGLRWEEDVVVLGFVRAERRFLVLFVVVLFLALLLLTLELPAVLCRTSAAEVSLCASSAPLRGRVGAMGCVVALVVAEVSESA